QHLPLLIRLPGKEEAGRRVPFLTQPVDLPATLLEAFRKPVCLMDGRSLWSLCQGHDAIIRSHACAAWRMGAGADWSLRTPDWNLLLPISREVEDFERVPQLYVKPDDRWEVNNVMQHHQELGQELEAKLRDMVSATKVPRT